MPLSKGQNWQINGQFIAASLLIILAHSYPLSPSMAYKRGLDTSFHHTQAPPHSIESEEALSLSTYQFCPTAMPQFIALFLMI
jgi:hypothetical protein